MGSKHDFRPTAGRDRDPVDRDPDPDPSPFAS